jgi:hypothetical protein
MTDIDLRIDKDKPWSCGNCGVIGMYNHCWSCKNPEGMWTSRQIAKHMEYETIHPDCGMRPVMAWLTEPTIKENVRLKGPLDTDRKCHRCGEYMISNWLGGFLMCPKCNAPNADSNIDDLKKLKEEFDSYSGLHPVAEIPKMQIIPPQIDLRDWFAGMALASYVHDCEYYRDAVVIAYQCADAMMKEREKK